MSQFTRKLSFKEVMALSPEDFKAYEAWREAQKSEKQKAAEYKEYVRYRYGEEEVAQSFHN